MFRTSHSYRCFGAGSLAALLVLAGAAFLAVSSVGALEPPGTDTVVDKVTICHATGAVNNPYVVIEPSVNAIGEIGQGHAGHDDIIPPFRFAPDDGDPTTDEVFPGLNWAEGEATYRNDCTPPPPPEPSSLTIAKNVTGVVPQSWSFGFGGGLGAFNLSDSDSSAAFPDIAAGQYTIEESALATGAEFVSVSCDNQDWTANGAAVTVDVPAGLDVTCTFVNNFPEPAVIPEPAPEPAPAPAPEAEPAPDVLGASTTRTPGELPLTGTGTSALASFGLVVLGIGALLVGGSWRLHTIRGGAHLR